MKVGILGAYGFVGTNVMRALASYNIMAVGGSRRTGVDATDVRSLINWIKENNIDHLINLAAECGGIGLNQQSPAQLWTSTTQISNALLEAARLTKIKKTIMVGTICSIAKDCKMPFKEEYLMHYGLPEESNRAYGIAKLSSLVGAQAYTKQYGILTCNLMPSNMYGPLDHFNDINSHVIPAIIYKINEAILNDNKTITLWGTGTATREFLYVEDFAEAIMLTLQHMATSEIICIGTGNEISIKDLANLIASIMGFTGNIIWDSSKPDGQPRRCVDASKAFDLIGFKAKTSLRDGLIRTIQTYCPRIR